MRLRLFVCLGNSRLVGNSFRNSVHINRLPNIIAYSIRCQLSHLRMMKWNDGRKEQAALAAGVPEATCNDSPELKELLDLLPTGVCRSDRTVLSQMPMPFLLFQEKAGSDDDGCEELPDEPEVVWKILTRYSRFPKNEYSYVSRGRLFHISKSCSQSFKFPQFQRFEISECQQSEITNYK